MSLRYIFIILIPLLMVESGFSQTWLPVGPGITCGNGQQVYTVRVNENNSKLIIAGFIITNGSCDTMRTVLTWDGQEYVALGNNQTANQSTLAFEFQNKIYASGPLIGPVSNPIEFSVNLNGIWENVTNSYDGTAFDCVIHDGIAYMAGGFSFCSGMPCGLVCSFDGQQVLPYYTGSPEGDLAYSVEVYQDTVYIGGNFTGNDGLSSLGYNKCCKIVNGQLEKVMNGINAGGGICYDLEVFDDKLYIGGWMKAVGFGAEGHYMYYYENGQLHTLPVEPDFNVTAMRAYNGGLYVAGDFNNIGEMPCNRIARWDGHEWTCLSNDMFYYQNGINCGADCIRDIEIWNDTLYIGGRFHRIGEDTLKRIAKLDMALSEAFPVKVTEQQRQELKLTIYPNPATHELNITLPPSANARDIIAVYDVHGRLIKEQRTGKYGGNVSIGISTLPQGMYVLRYAGKEVILVEQFVKE
jgi:hypothetical protein